MHPLIQQIRAVSFQARRLLLGRAFAHWLSVVLVATGIAGWSDWLFRYREAPLRWMALLAVAAVALAAWRKLVGPALRTRWNDRQLAQQVERYFPEIGEQLSTAVAFLEEPRRDPRYGSAELRADVVARTTKLAAQRDLVAVLNVKSVRPAWWTLGVVSIVLGMIIGAAPGLSGLALRRLVMPWREEPWPQRHRLVFVSSPDVLSYGADFEAVVEDEGGSLPDEVTIWYWFDGEPEGAARPYRMLFAGGRTTHRLSNVTRSFHYRATGGDDTQMPWRAVRVIVPPRIARSQITLYPPAYAGLPTQMTERRIRAVAGTRVGMEVHFDRPVAAATLVFRSATGTVEFAARIGSKGRQASLEHEGQDAWTLQESGTYSWELTDRDGVVLPVDDDTEVDVVPDLPPVVALESPEPNGAFTARANVPIRVLVRDDLGVHSIEWQSQGTARTLAEYPSPAIGDEKKQPAKTATTVEANWDLLDLGLQPGAIVAYEVRARDFLPQSSEAVTGTIRIITDAEFQRRLEQRQADLLERLKKALQLERSLQAQTGELVAQLKSQRELTAADAPVWPALEPGQRRVADMIGGDEGAGRAVGRLIEEIRVNRWEAAPLIAHWSAVGQELDRLQQQILPGIQQELVAAERLLRFESPDYDAVHASWSAATKGQGEVITALESLVDQLGEWDRYQNLSQEVRQVLDEQAALSAELSEMKTVGRELSQLSAEERAQLARLSQRFNDLAAQVDRLQSRLEQLDERLQESNPAATKALRDALQVMQDEPIAGDFREAARAVRENRVGNAQRDLQQSAAGLQQLLAALEQSTQPDAEALEKLLATAVTGIAARQEALLKQTTTVARRQPNEAGKADEVQELARVQQTLAAEVADLLRGMPAESGYAIALDLAARPMQEAAERLEAERVDEATIRLERSALDFLKDVLASLQAVQEPRPAQEPPPDQPDSGAQPPQEEPGPTVAELKLIRLAQLEILRQTIEASQKQDEGASDADQRQTLEELAARQRRLGEWLQSHTARPPAPGGDAPPRETPRETNGSDGEPTGPANERPRNEQEPLEKNAKSRSPNAAYRPLRRPEFQLVSWLQPSPSASAERAAADRPTKGTTAAPPVDKKSKSGADALNRALLDDDLPAPPARPAGEDLGQPSDRSPWEEASREMFQAEERLRKGDAARGTQQIQRRAAARLSTLIEQLEQQAGPPSTATTQRPDSKQPEEQPGEPAKPPAGSAPQPGTGTGSSDAGPSQERADAANWTQRVWGTLPDRVREQIQNFSDEQFLPEYEQLIRDYFDRLAEQGRE